MLSEDWILTLRLFGTSVIGWLVFLDFQEYIVAEQHNLSINSSGKMQSHGALKTGYELHGNQYSNPGGQTYSNNTWTQSSQVAPAGVMVVQHQKDWLVPAIIATIFCFWPTGIGAIVYAVKANSAARRGEGEIASTYSRHAKTLIIVTIVTGIVIIGLTIVARVVLTIVYS